MMNGELAGRVYLVGAVIVWVGLIIAVAALLAGTPYLAQVLPILGGGAFWFIVIVPAGIFSTRRPDRRAT
jgi:hypothetical protein